MEMTFISVLRPHTYVTLLEDSVMRQRLQLFIACVPRMQIVSTVAKSRYQTTTKSLEHATTLSLRLSRKHQQHTVLFFDQGRYKARNFPPRIGGCRRRASDCLLPARVVDSSRNSGASPGRALATMGRATPFRFPATSDHGRSSLSLCQCSDIPFSSKSSTS